MDWFTSLRSFVDVVESKSFSKAADKRFSSSSAMSRRISWLEGRVGVQLLARTTRTLQLTEEGVAFYESAKRLLQDFDQITEFAKNKRKGLIGSINISMPLSFSAFNPITDLLVQFLELHKEISFQLNYSNYMQDLIFDNVDIALRSSTEPVPGYSKFKLLTYQIGFFASPTYLQSHKKIMTPEDLQDHNCLVNLHAGFSDWNFKSTKIYAKGNVKTTSPNALTQLAIRNVGIIRASQVAIQNEIDAGKLVPILESEWVKPLEMYLFYRSAPGTPYRVEALVEYIGNETWM